MGKEGYFLLLHSMLSSFVKHFSRLVAEKGKIRSREVFRVFARIQLKFCIEKVSPFPVLFILVVCGKAVGKTLDVETSVGVISKTSFFKGGIQVNAGCVELKQQIAKDGYKNALWSSFKESTADTRSNPRGNLFRLCKNHVVEPQKWFRIFLSVRATHRTENSCQTL